MLTFEGITQVHVREWRNWLKPRYAVSTLNQRLAALSSFLSWCVDQGHIQTNPAAKVKKLKQQTLDIKWLTPADEGRVIRFAEREYSIAQNGGTGAGKRWAARNRAIRLRADVRWAAGIRIMQLGFGRPGNHGTERTRQSSWQGEQGTNREPER